MCKLIILLLFCLPAYAQQMNVDVKNLNIELEKFWPAFTNNSYYIPEDETQRYALNLNLDIDLSDLIYFDQRVTSIVGDRQFRHIGYDAEIGFRTDAGIDIYFRHFSGHGMDFNYGREYPQDNAIGVRFNILRDL